MNFLIGGCAGDQRSDIKEQCFSENRCPVSLKRRKIAGNSRLKGASWSKFVEFADEFTAIRAAELAEKLHQRSPAQPLDWAFDGISKKLDVSDSNAGAISIVIHETCRLFLPYIYLRHCIAQRQYR
jgi:hypothetical protein